MKRKLSLPSLKKKLWRIFTQYIKKRDKNICFTCRRKVSGYDSQGGHFIPKSICGLVLYFHEDNVHCQCGRCNLYEQGNILEYSARLGNEKVNHLRQLRKETQKTIWSRQDYEEKIIYYTNKLNGDKTRT